jgi:hypothetical protein
MLKCSGGDTVFLKTLFFTPGYIAKAHKEPLFEGFSGQILDANVPGSLFIFY